MKKRKPASMWARHQGIEIDEVGEYESKWAISLVGECHGGWVEEEGVDKFRVPWAKKKYLLPLEPH